MQPNHLVLIRHAESAANVDKTLWKIPSDSAIGLTAVGVQQAQELGQLLHTFGCWVAAGFHNADLRIRSSPMLRARQTMEIARDVLTSRQMPAHVSLSDSLKEFFTFACPGDDMSWFSYEKYLVDDHYPGNSGYSSPNVTSWTALISRASHAYDNMSFYPKPGIQLAFSHHYTIAAIILAYLSSDEALRDASVGDPLDWAAKDWMKLNPEELSFCCKRLDVPHAVPIHLTNKPSPLKSVWTLLSENRAVLDELPSRQTSRPDSLL